MNPTKPPESPDQPPREPPAPTEIEPAMWWMIARKTVREFSRDGCLDLAASLTFYAMLGLFPAIVVLLALVDLVGRGEQTVDVLLGILTDIGAGAVADFLRPILLALADSGTAGPALVAGLVVALWSASNYVGSFGRAMNRIYEVDEGRPFWKRRPVMLLITIVTVLLAAVVSVALIVTGPAAEAVGNAIGIPQTTVFIVGILKWPVILLAVVVIVALLYYATPNVRRPGFRWLGLGALVAIIVWIAASFGFGVYLANFSRYGSTYASLAGPVVLLLWLWITNLALLFGAELDVEVLRGRQLTGGVAAQERLQLPLRDTARIERLDAKHEQYVTWATRLQEKAALRHVEQQ